MAKYQYTISIPIHKHQRVYEWIQYQIGAAPTSTTKPLYQQSAESYFITIVLNSFLGFTYLVSDPCTVTTIGSDYELQFIMDESLLIDNLTSAALDSILNTMNINFTKV